jgi:hypothetical protein
MTWLSKCHPWWFCPANTGYRERHLNANQASRCAFRRIAPYDPCGSGSGLTTNWVNRSGPRDSILPSEFSCSPRPTARYRSSRPLRICATLGVVVGKREVGLAGRFTCQLTLAFARSCGTERLYRLRRQSLIACGSQDSSQRARREGSTQLAAE